MAKQRFGSGHTSKKLGVLDKYLAFYTRALKAKGLKLLYVDAFAGTGEILLAQATEPTLPGITPQDEIIDGSAIRALRVDPPFDQYIFIEKSRRKTHELERDLSAKFPGHASRCLYQCADANDALIELCKRTDWTKHRAVVFLDPFGNQIKWETIRALAATQAVDVWYLFPSGLGIYRQIPKAGEPLDVQRASVTSILGTDEWQKLFFQETVTTDLFGNAQMGTQKTADVTTITAYAIDRLRTVFAGGVLNEWLPLGGKAVPKYSLIFACANPRARALAHKVAKWIIEKAE